MSQTKNKVIKVLEKLRWFFVELGRAFWYLCRKSKPLQIVLVIILIAGIFYGGVCFGRSSFIGQKNTNKSMINKNVPSIPGMSEGKVTKIDEKSIEIKDLNGKKQNFTLDAKIAVLASGKTMKIQDVKKGDNIRIYFKAGTQVAYRVMLIVTKK